MFPVDCISSLPPERCISIHWKRNTERVESNVKPSPVDVVKWSLPATSDTCHRSMQTASGLPNHLVACIFSLSLSISLFYCFRHPQPRHMIAIQSDRCVWFSSVQCDRSHGTLVNWQVNFCTQVILTESFPLRRWDGRRWKRLTCSSGWIAICSVADVATQQTQEIAQVDAWHRHTDTRRDLSTRVFLILLFTLIVLEVCRVAFIDSWYLYLYITVQLVSDNFTQRWVKCNSNDLSWEWKQPLSL